MPIQSIAHLSIQRCNEEPDAFFIFGDNMVGRGKGPKSGQAVIRPCPNSIGIPTKHFPTMNPDAFFKDEDFPRIKGKLDEIFERIENYLKLGKTVYLPDNLGEGRSRLKYTSPVIFKYINDRLSNLRSLK